MTKQTRFFFRTPALLAASAGCILAIGSLAAPASAQTKSKAASKQTSKAKPAGWEVVYTDSTLVVSLNHANSKKQRDGTYLAHLRWVYTSDRQIEHDLSYRIMVEDRLINCKDESTKPVNATAVDANGKTVSSYITPVADLEYLDWSKRKPGTPNAKAFSATCKALKS